MFANFQPVLIPPLADHDDIEKVKEYFQSLYSSDTEYDAIVINLATMTISSYMWLDLGKLFQIAHL